MIRPPEEFSDVDLVIKEEPEDISDYAITVNTPPPSEFQDKTKSEKRPLKKTLRRTRKFVVDGVEMQVTTEKAIRNAENAKKIKRKQRNFILRELKVLHSLEQKEMSNLSLKLSGQMDNMMSNFENERNAIMFKFSQELEAMTSQQKRKIEELEFSQELDERKTLKTLKRDQERVTKEFKKTLRKERSEFKNTIPRSTPKKIVSAKEAELDEELRFKETEHYTKLNLMLNDSKNTIKAKYYEGMKKYEKMFLKDRLDVTMTREEQIWEMEKRQLHTKHQTLKEHMKEQYRLQNTQLIRRHDKEKTHVLSNHAAGVQALTKTQAAEKRALPTHCRRESNIRKQMHKQQMKIENVKESEMRKRTETFAKAENQRIELQMSELLMKHDRQKVEMEDELKAVLDDLQQHQMEKRRILMKREQDRLESLDSAFQRDFSAWEKQIPVKRKTLKDKFKKMKEEQEQYFSRKTSKIATTSVSSSLKN